jgi:hypothetical protein
MNVFVFCLILMLFVFFYPKKTKRPKLKLINGGKNDSEKKKIS